MPASAAGAVRGRFAQTLAIARRAWYNEEKRPQGRAACVRGGPRFPLPPARACWGLYLKLLVTGGAGFIGSNFLFYMREKHPQTELVCLDKLTYAGDAETLAPFCGAPGFAFVRADVADGAALDAALEEHRPDAVVHFAAESHVDRSIADPSVFVRTNTAGTQALLEACRRHGVERFHHVSTDEVYGDLDGTEGRSAENAPLRPSSPYAASKAGADLLCAAYARTYGMFVTVSRSSNNYGPYQFPEKLIPRMVVSALRGEPLPVYGDGLQVRDWLHVRDHCAAVDRILQAGRAGRVYNVSAHCERRNIDVVRLILEELGLPLSRIRHVADRPGHDRRYAADASRLREELGWEPETDFAAGLRAAVRWYLAHRPWWEHILSGEYQSAYARLFAPGR